MKVQLIIPMSGIGKRFLDAGYQKPKPLIKVNGKEIIYHVVKMFDEIERIIFICNENHLNKKSLELKKILRDLHPRTTIFSVKPHKKGPIHAVIESESIINNEIPTIVNYCDFNSIFNYSHFKEYIKKENPDGCVFTYTGFHPHMLQNTNYAYVKKNQNSVIDIQEKKPFTNKPMEEEVSSGTYFFKDGGTMLNYFKQSVALNLNVKGEYYVSMAYKPMIANRLKINTFLIDYFMQWGTPSDLEEFNWYSDIFKEIQNKSNDINPPRDGCLIMPMAGKGSRFLRMGYKIPKPFIKVSGQDMFLKALSDLPRMQNTQLITRKEIIKDYNPLSAFKKNDINIKIKVLEKMTEGQADTCLQGMQDKDINLNKELTISACDMGMIYDQKKLEKLLESEKVDILVWGCKGYPAAKKKPSDFSWIYEKDQLINNISVKSNLKDPLKDYLLIGTFTFKKAADFIKSTKHCIAMKKKVNDEYYVDEVINICIEQGLKVVLFEIDYFICWGTPNELLTYSYWEDCFDQWSEHPFKKIK
tara:strand:- start:3787 stop:5373 length:1587 start_codon:yes stop_codon:yes gene_type:complete